MSTSDLSSSRLLLREGQVSRTFNQADTEDNELSELFDKDSLNRKRLNRTSPGFATRVRIYLKPKEGSYLLHTLGLVIDAALAISYVTLQCMYIFTGTYEDSDDKIIQLMVSVGFTSIILTYSFFDASRFLKSWSDRIFYLISCIAFQKPILLPILLPGSCFKSFVAINRTEGARYLYAIDDVEVTEFVLAVQEMNFLYSFTLSALSALATSLSTYTM
jgi:hypothetical protein